jgi:hypothetical protein
MFLLYPYSVGIFLQHSNGSLYYQDVIIGTVLNSPMLVDRACIR